MKFLLLSIITLITLQANSQTAPESFSLVEYSPKLSTQSDNNYYSYAAAYVNLSIQNAYKQQIKNPTADVAYSFGFVDGVIQDLQKKLGKKGFLKLVGDSLYEGSTAGLNNLDYVFFELYKYGTISYAKFPYKDAKEIKQQYNESLLSDASIKKINVPIELYNPDSTFNNDILDNFKQYISTGVPIMISIDQPIPDCDWTGLDAYDPDPKDADGNHIVNIIGYNDKTRNFIIKNNYEEDCVNMYTYENIFKIMRWAYVIK